jgi:hypothetical protein
MDLKVVCQCGQKFKFDVEPVNGRMSFTVNCPVGNADGTAAANALIVVQRAVAATTVSPVATTHRARRQRIENQPSRASQL